jgi:DNA-directed RNA polymerase subunit RPC12/RpoP
MMEQFNTQGTDETVCPYCGFEIKDSCELFLDSGVDECPKCGKAFCYERYIEVTYYTCRLEEAEC